LSGIAIYHQKFSLCSIFEQIGKNAVDPRGSRGLESLSLLQI